MVANLTEEDTATTWAWQLADAEAQRTFQEARRLVSNARSLGASLVCLELGLARARDLFLIVGKDMGTATVDWLAGVEISLVEAADYMAVRPVTREPLSLRDTLRQRQLVCR